ncbi:MAG: hypothetical protein ACHBMF_05620 [Chromatiales bacterium]
MVGESERLGVPLPVIDSLLAATSLQHDLTIVTRNRWTWNAAARVV